MRINKIILPVAAASLLLTGCDDNMMSWGTPEGHHPVTTADIPLAVKEAIANYDDIKVYATQYTPNLIVGLGFGADAYIQGGTYKELTDANFQMVTPGNAMKMDAVVTNAGGLNFATIDKMIEAMPADMKLYGHNFIWHTQQRQTYLKSLIAPTLVVETDSDIQPLFSGDASDFNGGTTGGWGSWGSNKESVEVVSGEGVDGTPCAVLKNKGDGDAWSAQFAYTFDTPLDPNTEYTIRFKAKSTVAAGYLQFQYQNSQTYGSQGGYHDFEIGNEWTTFEFSFTPSANDADRIILNFGKVGATYYIDNIEFGTKVEETMENVMAGDASDFEGGTNGGWGCWGGNNPTSAVSGEGEGHNGGLCLILSNPSDGGSGNAWKAQCAYTFDTPLQQNKKYIIQFYAKSTSAAGVIQFQYQNGTTYGSQGGYHSFNIGTDWILCEYEFNMPNDDVDRILLNFGEVAADYYVDDIKFGLSKNQDTEAAGAKIVRFTKNSRSLKAPRKAKSYYILKSDEEKREALLGAMDMWIKGMADHLKEKNVVPYGYDVINEAIADGANTPRGFNNIFNGEDKAPVESETDGLSLNWADNHFYWGYYINDYAIQAFRKARAYLPKETKLFINDYNLETSPGKREAFIKFAQDIDAANGSPIVDGLGTQMHLTLSVAEDDDLNTQIDKFMAQVDESLTALAATGKLIRITELDISIGKNLNAKNLEAQAEAYRRVFESYKRIIPEAQQSGITIWTLSDNPDEHVYWLPDQNPNLWDANYKRKWAYKGVCDGIAGEDLGLKFSGDDYKTYYEKNNVADLKK